MAESLYSTSIPFANGSYVVYGIIHGKCMLHLIMAKQKIQTFEQVQVTIGLCIGETMLPSESTYAKDEILYNISCFIFTHNRKLIHQKGDPTKF